MKILYACQRGGSNGLRVLLQRLTTLFRLRFCLLLLLLNIRGVKRGVLLNRVVIVVFMCRFSYMLPPDHSMLYRVVWFQFQI